MKGVHAPSHLQSFAGVQFDFGKNSQKIDLNGTIRQRMFRFLKFEVFRSILKTKERKKERNMTPRGKEE